MKFKRALSTAIAAMALTACGSSMKLSPGGPSPLVMSSCPELTPLRDDSFGATTAKLVEVGTQYRECRAAAIAK